MRRRNKLRAGYNGSLRFWGRLRKGCLLMGGHLHQESIGSLYLWHPAVILSWDEREREGSIVQPWNPPSNSTPPLRCLLTIPFCLFNLLQCEFPLYFGLIVGVWRNKANICAARMLLLWLEGNILQCLRLNCNTQAGESICFGINRCGLNWQRIWGFLLKAGGCGTAQSLNAWLNLAWQLGSGFVSRLIVFQLKNNKNLPDVYQLGVNLAETQE